MAPGVFVVSLGRDREVTTAVVEVTGIGNAEASTPTFLQAVNELQFVGSL